MKGKLVIFSAPSGSGKTTVVKHLLQNVEDLEFSISATSREPRGDEQHGRDYYFLSQMEFRKKIEDNEFLEWEEVYNHQYYGTLKSEVERLRNAGKHVIFDIDVEGGLNLKKAFREDALAVFVRPPSLEVMEQRLRNRGTDSEKQISKRIGKAEKEMAYANAFDLILVNKTLEKTLLEAEMIVKKFIGA